MKRLFSSGLDKHRFEELYKEISEGKDKGRIQEALNNSDIENEGKLRAMVHGKPNPESTTFLMKRLEYYRPAYKDEGLACEDDASILAGILLSEPVSKSETNSKWKGS